MKSLIGFGTIAGLTCALFLAGCGGRAANPVVTSQALDQRLDCDNLRNQKAFNVKRIEDLEDERVANRTRSLARVPGAIVGNPISAIALADTSRAIYVEIDALEARNQEIDRQLASAECAAPATPAPAPIEARAPIDDSGVDYGAVSGGAAAATDAAPTGSAPASAESAAADAVYRAAPVADVVDPSSPAEPAAAPVAAAAVDDAVADEPTAPVAEAPRSAADRAVDDVYGALAGTPAVEPAPAAVD